MAKKKTKTVRAARTKPAKKKPTPARKAAKPARPKNVRLEGLEDMPRDRVLDAACLLIHDGMVDVNNGNASIGQGKQKALARMEATKTQVYIAHNTRLVYTPGGAKISAKLVDSDEGGEDTGEDAGAERRADVDGADLDELNGANAE